MPTDTPRRIGLLGGTFDPVHIGHLILAESARVALNLDHVFFVPAAAPPHKQGIVISPAEHRLAMLELAVAGNADFSVSRLDIERPGPHYTADLLEMMLAQSPHDQELWFLMGMDSLIDLPTWRDPDRIRRLARLAVAMRPGYDPDWASLEAALPGILSEITLLDVAGVYVSASDLRKRAGAGESIRYLVSDAVRDYIAAHALYR
ncbi:MAG: nicotinate-nucleotide adenylyltransferase [Caldilineales bacterium]|nr:nicotinate-nucleotide adenylyltransferase [Caldilineales bacterium]